MSNTPATVHPVAGFPERLNRSGRSGKPATPRPTLDATNDAINALTPEQRDKLIRYAAYLLRGGWSRHPPEFVYAVSVALASLPEGRPWTGRVSMYQHLRGVIRSQVSALAAYARRHSPYGISLEVLPAAMQPATGERPARAVRPRGHGPDSFDTAAWTPPYPRNADLASRS